MNDVRYLEDSHRYSTQLGNDYRRLYQLKESGAPKSEIKAQKALIKAHKSCLRNLVKQNSG